MAKKKHSHKTGQALHGLFREVFELHAALSSIMDKVHQQAGLSTSQHKIMRTLSHVGPATVPDIAALLGVSRQFVQTVCNDLLSQHFIEFKGNPRHKRSKLASLTELGHNAFQQARNNENRIIEQALPGIDLKKVKDACDVLEDVRAAVQKKADKKL